MEITCVKIKNFSSLGIKFHGAKEGIPGVTCINESSKFKERVYLDDELLAVGETNIKIDGQTCKHAPIIKNQMEKYIFFHLTFLRKKIEAQRLEVEKALQSEVNEESEA